MFDQETQALRQREEALSVENQILRKKIRRYQNERGSDKEAPPQFHTQDLLQGNFLNQISNDDSNITQCDL